MESKIIRITPAMATSWLAKNTINRRIRSGAVDGFVASFKRGEYQCTHQGIAFADSGELIDGQHRLTAISMMPESFGVEMMVTRGLSVDAFRVIDKGAKRTHSDALGISTGHAAVARFLYALNDTMRGQITTDALIPFVNATEAPYIRLNSFCPKTSKTWSSAAIRSAAILKMLNGEDVDYIVISYHALNHDDFDSMSPVVQALYRQQVRGLVNNSQDLFCRAWKAFDSTAQRLGTIQISDSANTLQKARQIIGAEILGQKKASSRAVTRIEAKKVNSANSTRLGVKAPA